MPFNVQEAMPLYVGNKVYLLGGLESSGMTTNQILVADVHDDGSLGGFSLLPDNKLVVARHKGWATRVGNFVYVLGGYASARSNATDKVERATVLTDGSMGPFAEVPGVKLAAARGAFAGLNTGTFLTVMGGESAFDMTSMSNFVATTERAAIGEDGAIGAFQRVDTPLVTKRSGLSGFRIGDFFYVAGGMSPGESFTKVALGTLERAVIGADGAIGAFSAVSSALSAPRHDHGVVTLADYVYFLGGYSGRDFLTALERGTFEASGDLVGLGTDGVSSLAESYSGGVVVQIADKAVYYIGGYNFQNIGGLAKVQKAPILKETIQ